MLKTVIAGLLSAALITLAPQTQAQTPETLTIVGNETKVEAVQAATTEKVEQKALTEPQAPTPEIHPKGCEQYRHLMSQYDWNVETVLKIAHAESGCNPSAVGDNRVIGGIHAPSCGIMQVRTLKTRPPCEALKDPATNIAWAYRIYQGQGYGAWSVCGYKVRCI